MNGLGLEKKKHRSGFFLEGAYFYGMSKRIWASLDDYLRPSSKSAFLGRNFANFYFFSALLKYSGFDEFHFFLSNPAHCALFLENHAPMFERLGVTERVRVSDRLSVIDAFRSGGTVVFHQSDHIAHFNALSRLRNRLGASVPITAFIHSISYPKYMTSYLEMVLTGASKGDALFCSSASGKRVLQNCFRRIVSNVRAPMPKFSLPVVPLGIDEGEIRLPEKQAARNELGLSQKEVIGLFFGRFSDVDKMDLFPLLQVFKAVLGGGGTFRLVLSGAVHSAAYLNMLRLWIAALNLESVVTIITHPDERTKWHLLRAADFFVSLSDNPQETFGLTLLEAMHAGLPLLVSDFDGYRELVPKRVGIRVPTYWGASPVLSDLEPILDERTFHLYASQSICVDMDALFDALNEMYRDRSLRERRSRNAVKRFEERYSHRRIIDRLEARWSTLAARFEPKAEARDWMSLDTFDTFSHYVTRRLSPDEVVTTSRFGRQILEKKANYPLLPNMAPVVNKQAVVFLMQRALHPLAISAFEKAAAGRCYDPTYLLLWMLKHGLLILKETDPQ